MEAFEIPGKPWKRIDDLVKTIRLFENDLIQDLFLITHKQIAFKQVDNQKLYTDLLRKYIESLAICGSIESFKYLKRNLSNLYNFIQSLLETPRIMSSEELVKLIRMNLSRFIPELYRKSKELENVAKEIILAGIDNQEIEDKESLKKWINQSHDIEGVLFDIFANELKCKIVEYSYAFDFFEIQHGNVINSDELIRISFFSANGKPWILMSIQEMEYYGINFDENKVHYLEISLFDHSINK